MDGLVLVALDERALHLPRPRRIEFDPQARHGRTTIGSFVGDAGSGEVPLDVTSRSLGQRDAVPGQRCSGRVERNQPTVAIVPGLDVAVYLNEDRLLVEDLVGLTEEFDHLVAGHTEVEWSGTLEGAQLPGLSDSHAGTLLAGEA